MVVRQFRSHSGKLPRKKVFKVFRMKREEVQYEIFPEKTVVAGPSIFAPSLR